MQYDVFIREDICRIEIVDWKKKFSSEKDC